MTNVGIFAPKYPPQTGGAAIYFRQVKRVLEDTEYTPHILTVQSVATLERVHPVYPQGFIHGMGFVPECYRLLSRSNFGLLHVHPHFPQWRLYRYLVKFMDVPIVYDCRDRLYNRRHIADGDHYLSAAGHIDGLLISQGVARENITRAPVVMPDTTPISPFETVPNNPIVAYVGDLTDAKGLPIAVSAVAEMDAPTLHVAGGGPYASRLRRHNANWLRYWGELSHEHAMGLIREADVLVLPSVCEGRPRVVLEALSVGTPVVSTDVGNVPETLNGAGVIVERDVRAIRRGLQCVLSDGSYAKHAHDKTVGSDESALQRALVSAYAKALG